MSETAAPLVAHVVHRLDYGGLENGLVNIINTMDPAACRHAVIALTEATEFSRRITNREATVHSLHKQPGKDPRAYLRLWSLLRELRPAILHTRNIGTMDCLLIGRLAGVPVCIHGEHGWDTHDPDGKVARYRRLRKLLNPLVTAFVTVSKDLAEWLIDVVGIAPRKVTTICNGVDTGRFRPAEAPTRAGLPAGFERPGTVVVGTVLRFQPIKDPENLARAFIMAREALADSDVDLKLVMLGDGPLKVTVERLLEDAGVAEHCWLPGMRDDVPALMQTFDLFSLPSRREGISNTVLEALATGLPVIASRTGGNPELVDERFGRLVAPESSAELAAAIENYARDAALREQQSSAARERAVSVFSLQSMAGSYAAVYTAALNKAGI